MQSSFNHVTIEQRELLRRTAADVAAYLFKTPVTSQELPDVICQFYSALVQEEATPGLKSAVTIEASMTDDYILCLEDGKAFKMLKGHLKRVHHMTPDEYRKRWGLTPNYPMVAPNYGDQRSAIAKSTKLGQRRIKHP